MIGEKIITIYFSRDDSDWTYVQTDSAFYEIRVGGINRLNQFTLQNHEDVGCPKLGMEVIMVWTDSETIFIELSDKTFIVIGTLTINSEGVMSRSVFYMSKDDFEEDERDFENDPLMRKLNDK